jgi:hypothetical protein
MKIIGISGKKQSGKNTFANFVNGSILSQYGLVDDFSINTDGALEVKTEDMRGKKDWGILDVTRKDNEFCSYALENIWPFVKVYHFADYLKKIAIDLFDLKPQQVYGSDTDKNSLTPYSQHGWRKHNTTTLPPMSARAFLQYLGTDVMREIKDSIWVDYTIKQIKAEQAGIALIPDVRFPNEVEAIKEAGGCVVRLTREAYASEHHCETALDSNNFDWKEFDYIIDNHDMSIEQLGLEVEKLKQVWSI